MSDPVENFRIQGVEIVNTFAEAFSIQVARVIITAFSTRWAHIAATEMCGNATSVIACDAEAAIEKVLHPEETPDGRAGVAVLVCAFSRDTLQKSLQNRVGQCVLTCPSTACYNGLPAGKPEKRVQVGGTLRYFGDGLQISKQLGGRRYWRIPVMDGEFVCEEMFHTMSGVAGGNLILCGTDLPATLNAAETAANAMRNCDGVILPFPGGIVRSGSKVGSKYRKLRASTNDVFCPMSRPYTLSELSSGCNAAYEIVIDGLTREAVQEAMRTGLHAALKCPGLLRITAGNYGGQLGKFHFHLKDLL